MNSEQANYKHEGYKPVFIYLFIWRESKGTIESDGERGDRIKANVNGYTFYIIIWLGISKKVIIFLNDLYLCFLWFRTSSSLSGSAWHVIFCNGLKMVSAVYRLTQVCYINLSCFEAIFKYMLTLESRWIPVELDIVLLWRLIYRNFIL